MAYENLRFEVALGVATITIAREKVLNALDARTLDELAAALRDVADLRGALITGAGEKAFVAGADISSLAANAGSATGAAAGLETARRGQALFRKLETCPRPIIACVNGFALGGGLELALACHFRYATRNAKLGLPEVKLGLIPGYGGTQRLPRTVGRGRALELILSGEPVDAERALRIGLVNELFESKDAMLEHARKTIATIASRGPLAIAAAIDAVDRGLDATIEAGLAIEAEAFAAVCATQDAREGTRAFLEKRPAAFKGA